MSITKNYAIAILDNENIGNISKIICKYGAITLESSSHIQFDTQPVNPNENNKDIIYFRFDYENESLSDEKLKNLIDELNEETEYYILRDEGAGKILVIPEFVCALDIKFDNIKLIKEGTYKKIDELKLLKTEFGTCKGFKPNFRPLESNPIGNITIKTENIYLFCNTQEDFDQLKELLSKRVMEIDSNLKVEYRELPFFKSS